MLNTIVPNISAQIDTGYLSFQGRAFRVIEAGDNYKADGSFVFIHGLFAAADAFEPLLKVLGQVAHCLAIDLPGHGKHPDKLFTEDDFSIEAISEFLSVLLRKRELQAITLVGHSLGGLFATATALKDPKLVKQLVLINSTGFSPHAPETLLALRNTESLIHSEELLPKLKDALKIYDEAASSLQAYLDSRIVRQSSYELLKHTINDENQAYNFPLENLRKVYQPTLVIWGENDTTVPDSREMLFKTLLDVRIANVECLYNPHVPFRRTTDISHLLLKFRDNQLSKGSSHRLPLHTDWNNDYPA